MQRPAGSARRQSRYRETLLRASLAAARVPRVARCLWPGKQNNGSGRIKSEGRCIEAFPSGQCQIGSFASKAGVAVRPCTSAALPKADVNLTRWPPPLCATSRHMRCSKSHHSINSSARASGSGAGWRGGLGQCGMPSNFATEVRSFTHACCERTNICLRGTL
jgi:hypothetical protein